MAKEQKVTEESKDTTEPQETPVEEMVEEKPDTGLDAVKAEIKSRIAAKKNPVPSDDDDPFDFGADEGATPEEVVPEVKPEDEPVEGEEEKKPSEKPTEEVDSGEPKKDEPVFTGKEAEAADRVFKKLDAAADVPEISSLHLKLGSNLGLTSEQMTRLGAQGLEDFIEVNAEHAMTGFGKGTAGTETPEQFADSFGLDPEDHDPEVLEAVNTRFNQMQTASDARIQVLQDALDQRDATTAQRQEQAITDYVTSQVNALDGDEWNDVKGNAVEIKRIRDRYKVLGVDFLNNGLEINHDKLFKSALNSLHGHKTATIERRKIAKKVEAREGQLISRTKSQNVSKKVSRRDAALAVVTKFQKNRGVHVVGFANEDSQKDGFLD